MVRAHSRLLITGDQSSEVYIRGVHVFISSGLVQVNVPARVQVRLRFELVVMGLKVARRFFNSLCNVLLGSSSLRKVVLILRYGVKFVGGKVARKVIIRVLVEIFGLRIQLPLDVIAALMVGVSHRNGPLDRLQSHRAVQFLIDHVFETAAFGAQEGLVDR